MADSPERKRRIHLEGLPPGLTLVRQLGSSPLSEVFLAADDAGRLIALKVLRPSAGRDPRLRQRWRREAQLLEDIHHPNLIRSYGAFEIHGRPALMLEYIEGASLRDRLREGPLGWEEAARIGVQVGRALQLLHRRGALHRDVKPHNILLHPTRGAVLADLGLVRRKEDPTLTSPGAALGSPAYMSPEQARDPSHLGPEADVYSLGATLHHALSGKPPFLGNGVGEVIHRVLHLEPEPLPDSVPQPLRAVLATAMAKDTRHRYARARDLANDLGRVLLGVEPRLVSRGVLHGRWKLAGAAALVLVAAGAAALLWSGGEEAREEAVAAGAPRSEPAPGPAPQPAERAPAHEPPAASRTTRPVEERFMEWVRPYEQACRNYVAAKRLKDALNEIDLLESASLPEGAGEDFAREREKYVRTLRIGVSAVAEQAAVDAEAILDRMRAEADRAIAEERFDREAWAGAVAAEWARSGLPVDDLPLRPGGPDPKRYLEIAGHALQEQALALLSERAGTAIASLRAVTARKLREGRFSEAKADWDGVRQAYLKQSPEGRKEEARIQALYALQARVRSRLNELEGRQVTIPLRIANVPGELLPPLSREEPHRLDLGNRRPLEPVGLIDLNPDALYEFLFVDRTSKDLQWQIAHLYWCQDRLGQALATMKPLRASEFPVERDPAFWVREWERELAGEADRAAAPEVEPDADQPAEQPQAPASPLQARAAEWRQEFPDARVLVRERSIELVWEEPDWSSPWQRESRWDRRLWSLQSWRLEWQLPAGAAVPRRVRWLQGIELQGPLGLGLSEVRIGEGVHRGLGVVPGARQVMEWTGGLVHLDGLPLGPWKPADDSWLRLFAEADAGFRPASVRVQVRYLGEG